MSCWKSYKVSKHFNVARHSIRLASDYCPCLLGDSPSKRVVLFDTSANAMLSIKE